MSFPSPAEAIALVIKTWEGEWQDFPEDSGNYARCRDGTTKLVGTMRGITPNAYAKFRGIDPCSITPAMLRKEVTLDVATEIVRRDYFDRFELDTLVWSPVTDIATDVALMSGPGRAIRMLQALIGTTVDGGIGPQTREALDLYLEATDIEAACNAFADARIAFYHSISLPGTKNAKFRQGWVNRANWARPSNAAWWRRWKGWTMPHPAGSSRATGLVMG